MESTRTITSSQSSSPWHRHWIALGMIVLALPGIRAISNSDFWMHLAGGRWIAGNGIPRTDPFSLTMADSSWVNTSWLYDLVLFVLWRIGGSPVVILVHVAAVLAAFLMLVFVARKWTGSAAIALALMLSAWLLAPAFEPRALILALFFPALFIFVLYRVDNRKLIWAVLLPVQILWTNMHISFLMGPALCALFALQARFQPVPGSHKDLRFHLTLIGGILAATLINPYFIQPHGAAISLLIYPVAQDWISPFSSMFSSPLTRHMVTLALLIGAGGLITQKNRLPIVITGMAVIGAFLVVRSIVAYVDIFTLYAFPFFCLSLSAIGGFIQDKVSGRRVAGDTNVPSPAIGWIIAVVAVVSIFTVVTNRFHVSTGSASALGLGTVTSLYPDAAADVIEHPDFPERAINLPLDGGYLLWRFPERKIFADQRTGVYPPDYFLQLARGLLMDEDEGDLLKRWDVEAIILSAFWIHTPEVLRHLQGNGRWEVIYFDGTTLILVESMSKHAGLLGRKEELMQAGLNLIEQERRQYSDALGGLFKAPNPARLIGAGNILQNRGRFQEAAAIYELLIAGAPGMRTAWLNFGISQARLGQYDEAVEALQKALRTLPKKSPYRGLAHMNMGYCYMNQQKNPEALEQLRHAVEIIPQNAFAWLWYSESLKAAGLTQEAERALDQARMLDPGLVSPPEPRIRPSRFPR